MSPVERPMRPAPLVFPGSWWVIPSPIAALSGVVDSELVNRRTRTRTDSSVLIHLLVGLHAPPILNNRHPEPEPEPWNRAMPFLIPTSPSSWTNPSCPLVPPTARTSIDGQPTRTHHRK